MEHKEIYFNEVKADDDTRRISGFGSIFNNTDQGGDIVLPGAFTKSLKKRQPAMLWQHDSDRIPGVWDVYEEQGDKGLYLEGVFAPTPLGDEAYALSKMKALTGLSIGYGVKKYEIDQTKGTRKLSELDLYEVSLVTFPMNEKATITRVKAANGSLLSERDFEEFLRDVGKLSQKEAKTVVSKGYRALMDCRDGEAKELETLMNTLKQLKY